MAAWKNNLILNTTKIRWNHHEIFAARDYLVSVVFYKSSVDDVELRHGGKVFS